MSAEDEEARAAAYRAQAVRRAAARAARERALRGDPALRRELARNWLPIEQWQQENRK